MLVETYQSRAVLDILKKGEVYRAKPNLGLKREYEALIDMLGLNCECPVFGVLKSRKKKTFGKVSGSVKLTLEVPAEYIYLTEFDVWADFIYAFKFSNPANYRFLAVHSDEITEREYTQLINELRTQKSPGQYKYPQVVMEKIMPSWLIKSRIIHNPSGSDVLMERIKKIFQKQ